jgi:phosphoesterase RecJ-like protein
VQRLLNNALVSINIDHHPGNTNFGCLNLTDEKASSSAELIYYLVQSQGYTLTPDMAEALYAAVLTDTGCFCFSNTTPGSLRVGAALVEAGARPEYISERIYQSYGVEYMKLKGEILDTLSLAGNGRIAWVEITEKMLAGSGVAPHDTQEFADLPRMVIGARVGVLFREMPGGKETKVSFRSAGGFDVQAVAKSFGGGGHRQAAGCVMPGSLPAVRRKVISALEAALQ